MLPVYNDGKIEAGKSAAGYFAGSDEDTCESCGADIVWMRSICCQAVVVGGEWHQCAGTAPLYGTSEYTRIHRGTLALYTTFVMAPSLDRCQAWRWDSCGDVPDGDALVWFGRALVRNGLVWHEVQGNEDGLVGAMRAAGLDPKAYRAREYMPPKSVRHEAA